MICVENITSAKNVKLSSQKKCANIQNLVEAMSSSTMRCTANAAAGGLSRRAPNQIVSGNAQRGPSITFIPMLGTSGCSLVTCMRRLVGDDCIFRLTYQGVETVRFHRRRRHQKYPSRPDSQSSSPFVQSQIGLDQVTHRSVGSNRLRRCFWPRAI